MEKKTIFEIIADGLDASVDGRGWSLEHQKAMNLANAAPRMLKALKMIAAQLPDEYLNRERPEYEVMLSGLQITKIAIAIREAENK